MKKRMYLKPRKQTGPKAKKHKIYIFVFFFIVVLVFALYWASDRITKSLKSYSKIEIEKFLDTIINELIWDEILEDIDTNAIIQIYKNEEGDILYADFNDEEVNAILSSSVALVQEGLIAIENGKTDNLSLPDSIYSKYNKLKEGIIIEVPTGSLIHNSLFSNIGPKIPIKIQLLGTVKGNIKTDIEEYGINNSVVSIKIVIDVTEQVVLPITSEQVHVTIEIPIATKLIQGKIPTYYQNGLTTNSPIFSLPTE